MTKQDRGVTFGVTVATWPGMFFETLGDDAIATAHGGEDRKYVFSTTSSDYRQPAPLTMTEVNRVTSFDSTNRQHAAWNQLAPYRNNYYRDRMPHVYPSNR